MAVVEIASLPEDNGRAPREIDLHLTGEQAVKLCRIRCGLQLEGARLAGCGRVIKDNSEAVRFLIEQATASA